MEDAMTDENLTVRCACGWEATGTESDVVPATMEHGRRLHNMDATREQVLAMASRHQEAGGVAATADDPHASS
jgi:predicted small metal-binding protein